MSVPSVIIFIVLTLGNFFPASTPPCESITKSNSTIERKAAGGGVTTGAARTSPPVCDRAPLGAGQSASKEELGCAALALFPFEWRQLGYKVVFLGSRPGYRGMTITRTRRIEIYVRPGDTPRRLAYTLAHEFGHAVDLTYNTLESRQQWMELRGIDPSTPWFGCNGCSDYGTPAGDFAEAFAAMLIGSEFYRGRMMPAPSAAELSDLAPFFTPLGLSADYLASTSDR